MPTPTIRGLPAAPPLAPSHAPPRARPHAPPLTRSLAPRLFRLLWQPRPAALAYAFAVVLALLYVSALYPLAFLRGEGGFFETGDAAQHVSGWWFYAQDQWRFPLLLTQRLNAPHGVSIAYTDSIPFMALLSKPFVDWLPPHFQYIGLWHGVAFVTQAVGAVFLARALNIRHALGTVAAVGLVLMWPPLLSRLGHAALMTHGLLLVALGLYFMGRRRLLSADDASLAFLGLGIVALLVHPYLLAMCMAVFLAFLLDLGMAGDHWQWQRLRLAAVLSMLVAAASVLGYLEPGRSTAAGGFGQFSMNLASPFCGGRLLTCATDGTGGQGEGANFFGAGVWLLLLIVLLLPRGEQRRRGRFPALVAMLALLTLYALSNKLYLGPRLLLSYPLPAILDKVTGTFRASGRFFWIVGYAILFLALARLLRKPSWWSTAAVIAVLWVQWLDLQPYRDMLATIASKPATNDMLPWTPVMDGVRQVDVHPAYGCGEADPAFTLLMQRIAGFHGATITTAYVARVNADCRLRPSAAPPQISADHLYAASPADVSKNPFTLPPELTLLGRQGACVDWRSRPDERVGMPPVGALLCRPGWHAADWAKALPQARPVMLETHPSAVWRASQLPTQVGQLVDDRLVDRRRTQPAAGNAPTEPDDLGVLAFGPYVRLPAGQYRWRLTYASTAPPTRIVGKRDIYLDGGKPTARELDSGSLPGTLGAVTTIEGRFTLEAAQSVAELRTFSSPHADLQLIGIGIEHLDAPEPGLPARSTAPAPPNQASADQP